MKSKMSVTKTRTLKDGSQIISLDMSNTQKKMIYEAAIQSNTLKLSDLVYQLDRKKTFKDIVISAFVVQSLKEYVDKHK